MDRNVRNRDGGIVTRRAFLGAALTGAAAYSLTHASVLQPRHSMSISPVDALAMAERRRAELIGLLSKLISVRSQSGETAEAAQGVVIDYLSGMPYRVEKSADRPSEFVGHAEYMKPSPPGDGPFVNLVARPVGRKARHALFAHIDTHSVEDGWVTDPYQAVVRDGRLYGLGSADDKSGVAAMLVASAAISEVSGPLPMLISSHGKGGGSRGSLPVFDRLRNSDDVIETVLYAHPAETGRGFSDIKHVVRGVLDLTVTAQGWQGEPLEVGLPDSAMWSDGGNALEVCWGAIAHLEQGVLRDVDVNVGRLEAGDRPGSVPDRARAEVRVLFDGDHSWKELLATIQKDLDAYLAALPTGAGIFRLSAEPSEMRTNPGGVDWNSPVTRVLRNAIEAVTGSAPASYPNHYGGDIRYPLRLLGAPAFGVGSMAGNFYGPNEWVDIDDLVRLVAVIILTLSGWEEA